MSWRDDFNGSLDTSIFGTSVAGDGAVAVSGGTLNMTEGANTANGVITYIKAALNTAGELSYTVRLKIDGTLSGSAYLLSLFNGTPACDLVANVNPKLKLIVGYSAGNGFYAEYKDTVGTYHYWAETGWTTTATYFNLSDAYYFDVSIIVRGSRFRLSIVAYGGTQAIIETAWVSFSSLEAYTTLIIFWGDIYTNAYYVTSMKADYVIYSDSPKVFSYYNGGTSGSNYKIGRAISFDGGNSYFRDPLLAQATNKYVITALAGETYVKDPFVTLVSGTYYLFYSAFITATSKWRIRYATSTDQEAWADQGYITTPGGAGTFNEHGDRFPVATYSGGLWRIFVGGQNASDVIKIGYYYGLSLGSLTSYASNPIIDLGSSGAWDDTDLLPVSVVMNGTTPMLHIIGLKASTAKWQGGVWTSPDWTTWAPNGSNPVVTRDETKTTTIGAAVSAGDISIKVADSTIFSNDDPIIISNASGSNTEANRVLSKADSTHITLYYPVKNAYTSPTATVSGYNFGSVGIEGLDLKNFPLAALGTPFQAGFALLETTSWYDYTAGAWVYNPSKTPPLPLGVGWDVVSSENLKWIHEPLVLTSVDVGAAWKLGDMMSFVIGGVWKTITELKINVGSAWKTLTS